MFIKNDIVFMGNDPQVRVDLKKQSDLSLAEFSFEILYDAPENFFKLGVVKYLSKRWCLSVYRKLRTSIWKVTHIGK